MPWHKEGLIFAPAGKLWWAKSYATIPTADIVSEDAIRIYFASLDENRYGRIGYIEVDARNPKKIIHETPEPVLDIGPLGSFDDSGVNPSCVCSVGEKKYLYYIGWQRCERVPYMLFTGLAISEDNGLTFRKYSRTPILDRTAEEPFCRSAPFVIHENGRFRMWYWSCLEWSAANGKPHYNNVIRYAESKDGIHWDTHPHVCIKPDFVNEYAVGRPWVIREGPLYRMWYSIRSFDKLYVIGYAESKDGIEWARKDGDAGIEKSSGASWDSEMICYPCILGSGGRRYLFYNGNRHGSSGIGYAVQEYSVKYAG